LNSSKIVKKFNWKDAATTVPTLIARAKEIYDKVKGASTECKALSEEAEKVFEGLESYVSSKTYLVKLGYHLLTNIGTIKDKFTAIQEAFKQNNYNTSGQDIGDLVKFAAFWGYKQ